MQQAVLKVSCTKLQQNVYFLKERTHAKLCAVVKADGYGHGGIAVAQTIEPLVDLFAVATVQEGVELRLHGIYKPILVFTPPLSILEALRILQYKLTASITELQDYLLLQEVAVAENRVAVAHLKLNTGMHRYGFNAASLQEFCACKHSEFVQIEGIYSHFYAPHQARRTNKQFVQFLQLAKKAECIFGKLCKHIAATGGFFADSAYHLDMVRIGLGIYGYLPNGVKVDALQPAMALYGAVAARQNYQGGGIGYSTHKPKNTALATVRVGYADGLCYQKGAAVPPCMDCHIVESTAQKREQILLIEDFQDYAQANNTIIYQALTAFGSRVKREYFW